MSRTYEIVCDSPEHLPRTLATLHDVPFLGWTISDRRCDMRERWEPVDGYRFKCRCSEFASAHTGDLEAALGRLGDQGKRVLSLRGIRYLRRLRDDPIRPPQNMQPSPDGGGFLVSEGRKL